MIFVILAIADIRILSARPCQLEPSPFCEPGRRTCRKGLPADVALPTEIVLSQSGLNGWNCGEQVPGLCREGIWFKCASVVGVDFGAFAALCAGGVAEQYRSGGIQQLSRSVA